MTAATEARLDELGLEALDHLAAVLHNDSADPFARIEAAKTILDLALGPPPPGGFLEDDEDDLDEGDEPQEPELGEVADA